MNALVALMKLFLLCLLLSLIIHLLMTTPLLN